MKKRQRRPHTAGAVDDPKVNPPLLLPVDADDDDEPAVDCPANVEPVVDPKKKPLPVGCPNADDELVVEGCPKPPNPPLPVDCCPNPLPVDPNPSDEAVVDGCPNEKRSGDCEDAELVVDPKEVPVVWPNPPPLSVDCPNPNDEPVDGCPNESKLGV